MVAAAIVGAAVISSAASTHSGNKAAGAQKDAANASNATQLKMYNQTREDQTPWRNAGGKSITELSYLMGLGNENDSIYTGAQDTSVVATQPKQMPATYAKYGRSIGGMVDAATRKIAAAESQLVQAPTNYSTPVHTGGFGSLNKNFTMADFSADPGYQFRMDEGMKAMEAGAAARGGLFNGGTLKALSRYSQNIAADEFGNAYNRYNNDNTTRFNRLSSIAGVGQQANSAIGNAGSNYATNTSNNQMAIGNANSANAINTGNAINNGLSNVSSYYMMKNMNGGGGMGYAPPSQTWSQMKWD